MNENHVSFNEQDLKEIWKGAISNVHPSMYCFLNNSKPISFDNDCLTVEATPFAVKRFSEPDRLDMLSKCIENYTGLSNIRVQFVHKNSDNSSEDLNKLENNGDIKPVTSKSVFEDISVQQAKRNTSNNSILDQFNPDVTRNKKDSVAQPILDQQSISATPAPQVSNNYAESNLLERMTFETYVTGDNNRFAVATAEAVAARPGVSERMNPLYFYSGVGLGKTHLMHAIGNFIIKKYPEKRVLYKSAENFMNEYIELVRTGKMSEFHQKYREMVDTLLIDDIQFLEDKDKTQEEFFHVFEALRNTGKQIVISSDRPLGLLPALTDRMRSRIKQGMIIDIQAPQLETRIAILQQKSIEGHYYITDDILNFIAESFQANVRELEGALNRVITFCTLQQKPITMENAKEALKMDLQSSNTISPESIMKKVCEYFKITDKNLTGSKRDQAIVKPRQLAMYLMREHTGLSLEAIGNIFNRNHTTVLHACRFVDENVKDTFVKTSLLNLRDMLKIK